MPGNLDLALRIRADLGNAKRNLDQLERELQQVGRASRGAARQTGQAARGVDRVAAASQRSSRRLRQTRMELGRLEGSAGRAAQRLSGLYLALGGIGAAQVLRGIVQAGLEIEALEQRFTFAAGSIAAGAREMAFVREQADRLGISFSGAAQGYSSLAAASRGTNIGIAETREIFLGIAEAATVLRFDAGQLQGALTAVEQIISKGKVTAEELRGQLGERLPGAVQIMARALGIGTQELDKMLEQGQLTSDALVPFARQLREDFADSIPDAADSAAASFARLGNAIERLQQSIAASGLLDWLAQVTDRLTDAVDKAERLGPAVDAVFGGDRDASGPSDIVAEIAALARADPAAADARLAELEDTAAAASRRVTELTTELQALGEPGLVDLEFFDRRRLQSQLGLARSIFQAIVRQVADAREAVSAGELDLLRAAAAPPPGATAAGPDAAASARVKAEERANAAILRLRRQQTDAYFRIGVDAVEREERRRIEALRRIDELEAAGADPGRAETARLAVERRTAAAISNIRKRELREAVENENRLAARRRQARDEALDDLADIERGLLGPYDRAVAEVEAWRASTVAAFEAAGLSATEYGATVDREVAERLAGAARDEADRRLRESRRWQDGAARAFRDYAEEAADAGRAAENAVTGGLRSMEDALVRFATTGKLEFSDLVNSIVADLARLAIRQAITAPLAGALFGALFAGGGPAASGFTTGGIGHEGGIAGRLTRRRQVPAWLFAGAPRLHGGGIAGGLRAGEVPAILRRGEGVFTPEQLRALGGIAREPAPIEVNITNNGTPQQYRVERQFSPDERRQIVSIFAEDMIEGGDTARATEARLGAAPAART